MSIQEFADIIRKELILIRYPNQRGRWSAKFDRCEVREGSLLKGEYGNGDTPDRAIAEYCSLIQGKVLVFDAMRDSRQEFGVPEVLS